MYIHILCIDRLSLVNINELLKLCPKGKSIKIIIVRVTFISFIYN